MAGDTQPERENWKDLALRIQQENDPLKVIELAHQLIARLDEEQTSKCSTEIARLFLKLCGIDPRPVTLRTQKDELTG